ncbi:hypothetical protein JZ751_019926 [Albula glossodonta]|uniref:Uncharacterized protein n=1 Tax=Albula glossodonta TaxID=121402 RepID=A0A8T2MU45_9TELE|nr:hypothetical protein JZ751_019926 [Albula glossodonta]
MGWYRVRYLGSTLELSSRLLVGIELPSAPGVSDWSRSPSLAALDAGLMDSAAHSCPWWAGLVFCTLVIVIQSQQPAATIDVHCTCVRRVFIKRHRFRNVIMD